MSENSGVRLHKFHCTSNSSILNNTSIICITSIILNNTEITSIFQYFLVLVEQKDFQKKKILKIYGTIAISQYITYLVVSCMLLDYTCELPVDIVIGQRAKKNTNGMWHDLLLCNMTALSMILISVNINF